MKGKLYNKETLSESALIWRVFKIRLMETNLFSLKTHFYQNVISNIQIKFKVFFVLLFFFLIQIFDSIDIQ